MTDISHRRSICQAENPLIGVTQGIGAFDRLMTRYMRGHICLYVDLVKALEDADHMKTYEENSCDEKDS